MRIKIALAALLIILLASNSGAVQFMGGAGLFHTQKAETNIPGQFNLSLYGRTAIKADTDEMGPDSHYNSAFHLNYGLFENVELGITQLIYQDIYNFSTDKEDYQIPGDTFFHLKFAGFKLNWGENPLFWGFDLGTSYRTADKRHNNYFEEFTAGGIGGYINLMFSYYWRPDNKEQSPSIHINAGYKNHNDHATDIMQSTQEIPISIAFLMATKHLDYSLELHGYDFIERVSKNKYSEADVVYVCPGIKYKAKFGLQIGLGVDINVYQEEITGSYLNELQHPDYRVSLHITGLFNTIRYAKRKHLERLDRIKREALDAEKTLEAKRAERRSWEQRLEEKQEELEKKKEEKKKIEENLKKEQPSGK